MGREAAAKRCSLRFFRHFLALFASTSLSSQFAPARGLAGAAAVALPPSGIALTRDGVWQVCRRITRVRLRDARHLKFADDVALLAGAGLVFAAPPLRRFSNTGLRCCMLVHLATVT